MPLNIITYTDSGSVGAQYRLRINGSNLELLRDGSVVSSQPLDSVDGIIINGGTGNDTFLIDELISLPVGITFNGGLPVGQPGDAIVITANADSQSFAYTNATDGKIVFASGGVTSVYNFTGIDPVTITGPNAGLTLNLPGGTDTRLEDDGTAGNNTSQLRDTFGGYEMTTFEHPTGSLTINGTATDDVTVTLADSFGAANVTIIAGSINENGTITTTGNVALTAENFITQNAAGSITASGLAATATTFSIDLTQATSSVTTFAANAPSGAIGFVELDGFSVGSVGSVDGITADGQVQLKAGGTVSQTTSIGAGSLGVTTTAGDIALGTVTNATGVVAFKASAGFASFKTSTSLQVGQVDAIAALAALTGITATSGVSLSATQITQTASAGITAGNAGLAATATSGNITLDTATNATNLVAFSATGNVSYRTSTDLTVGEVAALGGNGAVTGATAGTLKLVTTSAATVITQTKAINATTLDVTTGATGSVTLTNASNTIGTIQSTGGIGTGGAQIVDSAGGLSVGAITSTGSISLTTTGGDLTVSGAVNAASVTLTTSGALTVSNSVTTTGALVLDASGTTTLGVALNNLGSLITNATGATALNGGSLTTTGNQAYHDAVMLGANTVLTSTGSGNISFGSTVQAPGTSQSLNVNTAGTTTFGGVVGGGGNPLSSLTTNVGGSTALNGGAVTTTGAQTYHDAVTLGANTVLTSTGSGNISFASTVQAPGTPHSLTVNSAGTTTFGGVVGGGGNPLSSVTTNAGGSTALNGGAVTTTGAQTYHDAVTLGANAELTSIAGTVQFFGTLDGAFDLVSGAGSVLDFQAPIGGTTALASLTAGASAGTAFHGDVTTVGAQTYNGLVVFFGTRTLTSTGGGAIAFAGGVDDQGRLTVSTAGTATFNAGISNSGGLTQAGTGVTMLAAANSYTGATTVNAGTLLVNGSIVSTTTVNSGGTLGGTGTTGAVNVASGGHVAPGTSPGTLTSGSFNLQAGASFDVEIAGTTAGTEYDQLIVNGTVTLAGALNLSFLGGFVPAIGNTFKIIDNNGTADVVSGTFSNIGGSTFVVGDTTYAINYAGGDGNDVVITAIALGVNDAPVNTVPGAQSAFENTNKVITGLAVSDVDAASGVLTTTLSVLHGTLTVASAGGAGVAGSGTGSVTLTGTLAQINTTLSAAGNVVYKGLANFVGSDTLTVLTNDGGNTGTGGAQSDTDNVAITVGNAVVHWDHSVGIAPHPAGWVPVGQGDFNADGTTDVAWFNAATNNIDIWKLSNGAWAGSSNVGSHPAGYQPVGFSDYNGDGTDDVLWFNPVTRDVDLWKIVNGQWAGSVSIGTHPAGFTPALSGDFNGDGTDDIAWHNPTTNAIDIWKIVNGQWAGSVDVGAHPAGFQPALAGDFNGDGTSDIAWFNPTTGQVDIWKISNGQWAGSVAVGAHPAGWKPLGAGDFNLDGTSDIAWYNPTTNNIDIWLINNGQWMESANIGSHPGAGPSSSIVADRGDGLPPVPPVVAVGVGDFDHNGVADVMWHDTGTNRIDNWMLAFS